MRRRSVRASLYTYVCPPPLFKLTYRSALHVALFYTRDEIGMRIACLHALDTVAGAFSGLISFGVQHAHTSVANWRLLFIIEGAPGILLALWAMFVLPDRPEDTHILNDREREIALERRNRGCQGDIGKVIQRGMYLSVNGHDTSSRSVCLLPTQRTSSPHSKTGR